MIGEMSKCLVTNGEIEVGKMRSRQVDEVGIGKWELPKRKDLFVSV